MARTKSAKAKPWERLMMLLVNGGKFSKQEIMDKIDYPYEYRLSSLFYEIKLYNGIIKTYKDGRKAVAYELINPQEIMKYLSNRGFSPLTLNQDKVESLADLGAEKLETVEPELTVEEVTE